MFFFWTTFKLCLTSAKATFPELVYTFQVFCELLFQFPYALSCSQSEFQQIKYVNRETECRSCSVNTRFGISIQYEIGTQLVGYNLSHRNIYWKRIHAALQAFFCELSILLCGKWIIIPGAELIKAMEQITGTTTVTFLEGLTSPSSVLVARDTQSLMAIAQTMAPLALMGEVPPADQIKKCWLL